MYQGKFSAGSREDPRDIYRLIEERAASKKAKPAKTAEQAKKPPVTQAPAEAKAAPKPAPKAAPNPPAAPQSKTPPGSQAAPRPRVTEQPQAAPRSSAAQAEAASRNRLGALIFWTCFFGFVFVFYGCTLLGLNWLKGWLVSYEQAQPTAKSQQIFEEYFRDPDWSVLYDLTSQEESQFQGKEDFCAYMEQTVAGRELTMLETSNGLSQDKKYLLRLEGTPIASFTLTDLAPGANVPQWELGDVELFPKGQMEILITMAEGSTALVNGAALGQEQIIATGTLPVRDYLPTFAQIPSLVTLRCSGLLTLPQVIIRDAAGTEREAVFDPDTNTFTQDELDQQIPDEFRETAMEALKAYVVFMSTKGGGKNLARYFDTTSDIYKELTSTDRRWTQEGTVAYANESVTGYRNYSPELFSAWVGLDLNITRPDGSVKTSRVEQTMFFTPNSKGDWVCYDMTAQNLSDFVMKVKLTFQQDGVVLDDRFYLADGSDLVCPIVSAPEGKVFTGWVINTVDETGAAVMKLMFTPDAQGRVTIPQGFTLESMVLEPLFE